MGIPVCMVTSLPSVKLRTSHSGQLVVANAGEESMECLITEQTKVSLGFKM